MKLVFYSGGDAKQNYTLNKRLLGLTKSKDPIISFIPSTSYECEKYFYDFVKGFHSFQVNKFLMLPIDIHIDTVLRKQVFQSDIIFLDGGNTFYFLENLRKKKILKELKDFVKRGGVLAGLSAGAILMTPEIYTASFPEFDRDENEENLTNWKSLDLVPFDFFPHFVNSKRYNIELTAYSVWSQKPLYACKDGCGIVVDGSRIEFIGESHCFFNGSKFILKPNSIR